MSADKQSFSELELKDPFKNQTKPTEGLKSATLPGKLVWKE